MNTGVARIEYKFQLNSSIFQQVLPEIESRLGVDRVANCARYPILSEYWDSPGRDIYWERQRSLSERRKFRIRIYGTDDGTVAPAAFLEVKHKSDGRGVKRRLALPVEDLGDIQADVVAHLERGIAIAPPADRRVHQEILTMIARRTLAPSCQLRYDRMAYEDGDPEEEFRVTFDSSICCRTERLPLRPDCRAFPHEVLPADTHLMEVKAHRVIPYWMRDLIGRHRLYPLSFSKYSTAMEMFDPYLRGSRPATPAPNHHH